MKSDIANWLRLARSLAVHRAPYLSRVFFNFIPVPMENMCEKTGGMMGVSDQWHLFYDPDPKVAAEYPNEFWASVLMHEAMHLLRYHSSRALTRDKKVWNLATDMEINESFRYIRENAGPTGNGIFRCTLPADAIPLLSKYGLTDEKTYHPAEKWYPFFLELKEQNEEEGKGGPSAACGSGSGGEEYDFEKQAKAAGKKDPGMEGVTGIRADSIRKATANDIKTAIDSGKIAGDDAGMFNRIIEDLLTPAKVPWQQLLRNKLRGVVGRARGRREYTQTRMSRRSSMGITNARLPGTYSPLVSAGIIIDTSGSMSKQDLLDAMSETQGILKALEASITVFSVDAAAGKPQTITDVKRIVLTGGGGTDMRVGTDACYALKPRPAVCIIMTDGYTPWPHKYNKMEVIACITGANEEQNAEHFSVPSHITTVFVR